MPRHRQPTLGRIMRRLRPRAESFAAAAAVYSPDLMLQLLRNGAVPFPRTMQAVWNGVVIAESEDTVVVEGNHYFPAGTLDPRFFEPSQSKTFCSWKGSASYFHVVVDGRRTRDAAWYYPDPLRGAEAVWGRVAFWRGVEVIEPNGDSASAR